MAKTVYEKENSDGDRLEMHSHLGTESETVSRHQGRRENKRSGLQTLDLSTGPVVDRQTSLDFETGSILVLSISTVIVALTLREQQYYGMKRKITQSKTC